MIYGVDEGVCFIAQVSTCLFTPELLMFQGTGVSKFARAESETSSSVTFSNSGSTPNGSPLGSDTEEEANDEELVK